MGKTENSVSENKSQAARLKRLVRQAFVSVAAGAVLLLALIFRSEERRVGKECM